MRWRTSFAGPALRRALIAAGVALVVALGAGMAACQSGDEAAREEYQTYFTDMKRVFDREGAEDAKVRDKSDATEGALNAYAVFCGGLGASYAHVAARGAKVDPPPELAKAHRRLLAAYARSAATLKKVDGRIDAEIRDPGVREFSADWMDDQTKPVDRALEDVASAYKRWYAAVKAEGKRLGLTFSSE